MKRLLVLGLAGALTGLLTLTAAEGRAERRIVDRIVGVVGDKAILLSDLRARAKPFLKLIERQHQGASRIAAEVTMYRDLLTRLVDEELIRRAAAKEGVTVTSDEIERSIASIAAGIGMSKDEVLRAARDQGLTETEYRAEVGRQILEGKILQVRVRARPADDEKEIAALRARLGPMAASMDRSSLLQRVMVERVEAERKRWLEELRKDVYVDARL
jgi:peptidyl-prolyl cis-trans isomerase SurA